MGHETKPWDVTQGYGYGESENVESDRELRIGSGAGGLGICSDPSWKRHVFLVGKFKV